MDQALQIGGALLILIAYGLAQAGRLDQRSTAFLLLNLVGSIILGWLAAAARQWGFVLLESAWVLISLYGLATRERLQNRPAE